MLVIEYLWCNHFGFVIALHFLLADASVGGAAEKDDPIGDPPKERFHFAVPIGCQHCLSARFRRAGDVVRQRWRHLNLKARHIADGKAKHASSYHHGPKSRVAESGECLQRGQLSIQEHQWQEKDACIQIIVEAEEPNALVDEG